jgi:integrase/recombinase XerD
MTDMRKVTRDVVEAYREKVMNEPIAVESRALKIRPVKRLFEHLARTHRLLINPAEGIKETCRRGRKIGPVMTLDEMKRLLEAPNLSLRTGIRDRALMEALYSTGMRLDELLFLEISHVDLRDMTLFIRKGKGAKQRVVPLGKNAGRYLREYLEDIRPWYARKNPREGRLFINHSGLPLTRESVRALLQKHRTSAKIRKPVSPHVFRRTCATHLLQQGADIRYIQELLGHKRLDTTMIYTKVMPVDVKKTHERTHPKVEP